MENFISVDGTPTRYLGTTFLQFPKAIETEWQGVLDFKAVTIMDSVLADVVSEQHRERGDIISPRSALEGDRRRIQGQGQMVRARVHRS